MPPLDLQLWSKYDPEAEAAAAGSTNGTATPVTQARKEYVDVVVSEVRGGTETAPFSFAVQILQNGGTSRALEPLARIPGADIPVVGGQAFPSSKSS